MMARFGEREVGKGGSWVICSTGGLGWRQNGIGCGVVLIFGRDTSVGG